MLVVVEGPEKVGKTTLIKFLEQYWNDRFFQDEVSIDEGGTQIQGVHYIHHVKGDSNHARIMADLAFCRDHWDCLVLMDRWWLSELVYRPHDGEPNTLPLSPWELEARYGGLADALGVRILLQGDPERLRAARTPDDIDIDPAHEMLMYEMLAAPGWRRFNLRPTAGHIWVDKLPFNPVPVIGYLEQCWRKNDHPT